MNNNPWSIIKSNEYDAHMSHSNVMQTQKLCSITKDQLGLLPKNKSNSCLTILGVTNGNGLEHINLFNVRKIIGIDINIDFLDECRNKYPELGSRLNLYQLDLMTQTDEAIEIINKSDLIIANLLIEHIHLDNFIKIISGISRHNQIISCVIQKNPDGSLSSSSGVEYVFDEIVKRVEEEDENQLISAMEIVEYKLNSKVTYDLPNKKQFIRLDFSPNKK